MSETEMYATPADAVRRAHALSDRFNELMKQTEGPSAKRRTDIPAALQDEVFETRARYREFLDRPTFGAYGMLVPRALGRGDYSKLQGWYSTYRQLAARVAKALPEPLRRQAHPQTLPKQDVVTPLAVGSYTLLAAAALGWLVLRDRRSSD